MGFFDKLTGTRQPDSGITPRPVEDVQAMLLGLNGPDVPYVVRDGAPEGADLVAEWRLREPAWQTLFARTQLSRALQIRMRFDSPNHVVRTLDHQSEIKWVGDTPVSKKYGRGPAKTVSKRWTVGRGDDGRIETTETFHYDTDDMKDPLRDAVLKAGWTWRGIVYAKL